MKVDCPTCDDSFDTEHGMKVHHVGKHGESLAKVDCECETCGEKFTRFQSQVAGNGAVYCSKECKYEQGRVEIECNRCGETVTRPEHRVNRYEGEDGRFCSRDCYLEYRSEGGSRAPGYIDGRFDAPDYYTNYNKTFRENREKALERDEYECTVCAMTNTEHKTEFGSSLHVHHVRPIADFETAGDAHELDNLTTLCLPCHRRWEGIPITPEASKA